MATLFPHLTSTGPPPTSSQVLAVYQRAFNARLAEGSIRPFVLPYHFYGFLILLAYLCIPHTQRPWLYAARWPVLAGIWWFQWKTLWEVSSLSTAIGFASGLISAFGAVWAATWLVFYSPQWEAKRVNARPRRSGADGGIDTRDNESNNLSTDGNDGATRKRKVENGHVAEKANGHTHEAHKATIPTKEHEIDDPVSLDYDPSEDTSIEYYWQRYPSKFVDRLFWTSDLLVNFRMPGWNLAIPPLPSLPPTILAQLGEPIPSASSSIGLTTYPTRRALLRARTPTFIIGYFVLDILKTVMLQDPYFIFGPTTYSLPPYLSSLSPLLLHTYRALLSGIGILVALEMVFLLGPILFCFILGPRVLGLRGQAIYYPTIWGRISNLTDKGLNGLWGSWWHQTFRLIFSAPTNFLIKKGVIKPRSALAKTLSLICAFGISGLLHAAGSTTQLVPTHPIDFAIFFMLQAVGVIIQTIFTSVFRAQITKLPSWTHKVGNAGFVVFWIGMTGHWFTDDLATGGVWLFEPIPVSILGGLGLSESDRGWWCWGPDMGVGWYTGRDGRWWESGIAL